VYVSSGTSIHPNIAQVSLLSETTIFPSDLAGAEVAKDFEVEMGTKWNVFDKRFSFNSAVFCDWATDPAPEDLDNPLFVGTERVIGWEFGAVGHLTDKWQVRASYTYEYGTITASNNPANATVGLPMLNAPKNTASLWMTYDLPWGFQVGAGLNSVSARTASFTADPANGLVQQAPGYIIFSAMLKYRVSKNVEIQLNATNLTDRYYYDLVDPGHVNPGEGRTLFITTNFKF
jgi:catecholate siderophore receptor